MIRGPDWALPAAAGLGAAEAAVLIGVITFTGSKAAPLIIAFLAVKFPFCWMAARVRPAGYLALFAWEIAGVVAALGASGYWRFLEMLVALAVIALLVASTSRFPPVRLPDSRST